MVRQRTTFISTAYLNVQALKNICQALLRIRETFITSNFPKLRFLYIWIGFFL